MKLGLSMWSVVSLYGKGFTVKDFAHFAAELGVDGVELLDYFWTDKATEPNDIVKLTKRLGLDILCYSIDNDFVNADASAREKMLDYAKREIDLAVALGAPVIRVFSGNEKDGIDFDTGFAWIVDGLREAATYAEEKQVVLALENHGTFAGTSAQIERILDEVGSPALTSNFDTGNFMLCKENPKKAMDRLAHRVGHVHFKDFRRADSSETVGVYTGVDGIRVKGTTIGAGDVDLPYIVESLKQAGYQGSLVIEYEGTGDVKEDIRKSVAYVRKLL
ncbi:MAG: sugar phosphate isomerase/epimerase [Limnochordia bacterium]|nr:sugar phosphate isomerase/epimerase [Limnochordia bacterium]